MATNIKRQKRVVRADATPYKEVLSGEDINLIRDKLVFNGSDEELTIENTMQIPTSGEFSVEIRLDTSQDFLLQQNIPTSF